MRHVRDGNERDVEKGGPEYKDGVVRQLIKPRGQASRMQREVDSGLLGPAELAARHAKAKAWNNCGG